MASPTAGRVFPLGMIALFLVVFVLIDLRQGSVTWAIIELLILAIGVLLVRDPYWSERIARDPVRLVSVGGAVVLILGAKDLAVPALTPEKTVGLAAVLAPALAVLVAVAAVRLALHDPLWVAKAVVPAVVLPFVGVAGIFVGLMCMDCPREQASAFVTYYWWIMWATALLAIAVSAGIVGSFRSVGTLVAAVIATAVLASGLLQIAPLRIATSELIAGGTLVLALPGLLSGRPATGDDAPAAAT